MEKRVLFLFLILLVSIFALSFSVSARDDRWVIASDLSWTFDDATGTLTVSGHGHMFFSSSPEWYHLKRNITKVIINEGLVSVWPYAFSDCENLKSVSLAQSVAHINDAAFRGCKSLIDIDLKYVTSLGIYAFYGCSSLTELTVPDGVTDIGDYAFFGCTGLRTLTFHNNLVCIGDQTFSGCTGLTSLTIPDSVQIIGDSAFGGCTNLAKVTLGSGLITLREGAFRFCTKLKSICIPDKVSVIEAYTFKGCTALEEITIGTGITEFKSYALDDCTNLKEVHFLGKPPNFDDYTFRNLTLAVYYWGGILEWKTVSVSTGNVTFTPVFCENHTVAPLAARAPSCTQKGLSAGSNCSVCKQILTPQQPIPKLPHTYGEWKTSYVTETTQKFPKKRICSICGYVEYAKQESPSQGNAQPSVPTNPVTSVPDPSVPIEITPAPSAPEQTEASIPTQNTVGNEIPTNPAITNTPKDTKGAKNAFLFVGRGILLLGLVASGIIFLKPKLTRKKEKQ